MLGDARLWVPSQTLVLATSVHTGMTSNQLPVMKACTQSLEWQIKTMSELMYSWRSPQPKTRRKWSIKTKLSSP